LPAAVRVRIRTRSPSRSPLEDEARASARRSVSFFCAPTPRAARSKTQAPLDRPAAGDVLKPTPLGPVRDLSTSRRDSPRHVDASRRSAPEQELAEALASSPSDSRSSIPARRRPDCGLEGPGRRLLDECSLASPPCGTPGDARRESELRQAAARERDVSVQLAVALLADRCRTSATRTPRARARGAHRSRLAQSPRGRAHSPVPPIRASPLAIAGTGRGKLLADHAQREKLARWRGRRRAPRTILRLQRDEFSLRVIRRACLFSARDASGDAQIAEQENELDLAELAQGRGSMRARARARGVRVADAAHRVRRNATASWTLTSRRVRPPGAVRDRASHLRGSARATRGCTHRAGRRPGLRAAIRTATAGWRT